MRGFPRLFSCFWGIFLGLVDLVTPVWADKPVDWQVDFQTPVTPVMERIVALHDFLLVVQFGICTLVAALIFYIIFRFRASKNPTPSKITHNSVLEVVWTLIPVVILLFIAFPSLRLLYYMDVTPKADMTVKAIGNQWYWTYEYPDEDITFDSMLVEDADLKPGQMRLFEVDNRVIVPVNATVRLITTSNDVLHSWAVPAFGVKKDSIPGRLNETWFRAQKEGTYYGQCSELCGVKHGFMPIVVEVVSQARYQHWLAQNKPEPTPEPEPVGEEKKDQEVETSSPAKSQSSEDKGTSHENEKKLKEASPPSDKKNVVKKETPETPPKSETPQTPEGK